MSTIDPATPAAIPSAAAPTVEPRSRSALRAVALPSEHGGGGLTAEPILLGLLVAPSVAGALIGAAGVLAFLARTPLKVALVDASRHRSLERTALARRVAAAELTVLAVLVAGAVLTASSAFWVPAVVAAPLVGLALWFDMRSRSRRLAPELAGAVGISAICAMVVLAGGGGMALALGTWLVLAARVAASIPFIRRQVASLHGRSTPGWPLVVWDLVALAAAAVACVLDRSLVAGAVSVAVLIALQHLSALRPAPRAVVLGVRQTVLGLGVVLVTWLGVLLRLPGAT